MTTTPTLWSNNVVFDPNFSASDTEPKLLTLADDTFILGWEDGNRIHAKHLDPLGSFTAGDFLSGLGTGADKLIQPQFVQTPDGHVVVVYNEKPAGNSDFDTFWRQANANFTSLVPAGGTIVGPTANDELIQAASASSTGSAIVYNQSNIGSGQAVLLVFVNSAGLPSTNTVVVGGHPAATIQLFPVIESIFNGDVAVAYTNFAVATGSDIRMHLYHRDSGTGDVTDIATGTEVVVSASNVLGTSFAEIGTLNGGTLDNQIDDALIVVWQDNAGINFRRFGNETGGAIDANPVHAAGSGAGDIGAHVTGLNDGGFIISWQHNFGTSGKGIVLQRFDANGLAIGQQVVVDDAGDEGSFGAQLATLADGRVVLAYTNGPADPNTAVTTLDYVIVDPREATINGSAGADTIVGRKDASIISGLAGADHLIGMSADDKLDGGDGNDILTGGKGKDALTGGLNNDTFDFNSILETRVGKADVIKDFTGADHVDLKGIDAVKGGADNKFIFIGIQAFHHKAGELHYVKHNNPGTAHDTTVIEGDVDGNGKADFQIVLTGLHNLHGNDFVL